MDKRIIISIFFIMILSLSIFNLNASEVYDGTDVDLAKCGDNIVMDSEGNYYVCFFDDSDDKIKIYKSDDDGDSWVSEYQSSAISLYNEDIGCLITVEDVIHIYYIRNYISSSYVRDLKYDLTTQTASTDIVETESSGVDKIRECAGTTDAYGNVYISWYNKDDDVLSFRKYSYQLETWGTEIDLYSTTKNCVGLSMDCADSNVFYVSYIVQDSTNGNDLNLTKYNDGSISSRKIRDLTINSEEEFTDIAFKDNYIHIVYNYNVTDGDTAINYTVGTWSGSFNDEQLLYFDGQDFDNPNIAISQDDNIHIIAEGIDESVSTISVIGKRGSYGDWSDKEYFLYDSSDNYGKSGMFYQNFPSNLNAQTGFIGCALNVTDDNIEFFDYGIILSDEFDTEYSNCQNDDFLIEYLDGDIMSFNNTYRIRYYTEGWAGKKIYIFNSTTDIDEDHLVLFQPWLSNDETIFFTPKYSEGYGSYRTIVIYSLGSFNDPELYCDFSVINGSTTYGNWSIFTDKSTYNYQEHPILYYIIPNNHVGNIKIYNQNNNLVYESNNILGNGLLNSRFTSFNLVKDYDYDVYIYNATDNNEMNHTVFTVVSGENDTTNTTGFDDSSWYGLPYWVPYLIGIFITLFITFSPLIIAVYITRKTKWKKIEIPPLLYVGFFFMGLITSVLMGFLPIWLPFVILFGMVVYFAVQWLYGSKSATGEE